MTAIALVWPTTSPKSLGRFNSCSAAMFLTLVWRQSPCEPTQAIQPQPIARQLTLWRVDRMRLDVRPAGGNGRPSGTFAHRLIVTLGHVGRIADRKRAVEI